MSRAAGSYDRIRVLAGRKARDSRRPAFARIPARGHPFATEDEAMPRTLLWRGSAGMTPAPWAFVLLDLAAWRTWRLIALDDLPPIESARNWIVGAEIDRHEWIFARPTLAHFIQCAYCSGFWIALAWWAAWLAAPGPALAAAAPFALSAAVGLVAQRLG